MRKLNLNLNFLSDLTTGQKFQVAFLIFMFSLAGFLVWRSTRPAREMTITSWVENRKLATDPSKPISPTNPADPKRSLVVTIFACHDGHLEITECPDDPDFQGGKPAFNFIPSTFIKSYDFYKNPTAHLRSISDPARYAVALTAYNMTHYKALNLGPSLITRAAMTIDQAKTERSLQHELVDKIDHVRQDAKTGYYKTDLRDSALAALSAYRSKDGDPTRDSTKASLAWKVLDTAMAFINAEFNEESAAVDKYTDGVLALLTRDQKAKLAEAGKLAMTTASLKLAAEKPALDESTGLPNLAYVKQGIGKSITIIGDAVHANDDTRTVGAVALLLQILDDSDLSTRFKGTLQAHIDLWLRDLIAQKRNELVESLASASINAYPADELFVSLCEQRRKLDPGNPNLVFTTLKGGAATMRSIAAGGGTRPATRSATTQIAGTRLATTQRAVAATNRAPAPKAARDADGIPNVSYIANSIPKGLAAISDAIKTNDDARIRKIVALIDEMYASPTLCRKSNSNIFEKNADQWVRDLIEQKRFDDADRIALATISKFPYNLTWLETLQADRVQIKLAQAKPDEALPLAKSLYNVCSLGSSTRVADLLCQCKQASSPAADLKLTFDQFKQLQIPSPPPAEAPAPSTPSPLLTSIKVDGHPYEQLIATAETTNPGFDGLIAKGNLLLLADQPKDAQACFEKALTNAADKETPLVHDAIARSIRAQDGALSRALSYLEPHQPTATLPAH